METNKEYLQRFIDSCDVNNYNTGHLLATKKYSFGSDHVKEFMEAEEKNGLDKIIRDYATTCMMLDRDGMPTMEFKDYLKQRQER